MFCFFCVCSSAPKSSQPANSSTPANSVPKFSPSISSTTAQLPTKQELEFYTPKPQALDDFKKQVLLESQKQLQDTIQKQMQKQIEEMKQALFSQVDDLFKKNGEALNFYFLFK